MIRERSEGNMLAFDFHLYLWGADLTTNVSITVLQKKKLAKSWDHVTDDDFTKAFQVELEEIALCWKIQYSGKRRFCTLQQLQTDWETGVQSQHFTLLHDYKVFTNETFYSVYIHRCLCLNKGYSFRVFQYTCLHIIIFE